MKLTREKAGRDFSDLLPRLVGAYESGRLVPFIGSGMSAGACTSWPTFIQKLEDEARIPHRRLNASVNPAELIQRANRAVRVLRSLPPGTFETALRKALVARRTIPAQTQTLAKLWWPLVLTTNYDNCYVSAFRENFPDELHAIVGRSSEDCQRVLTSLSNPGRALLWALQGHVDAPHKSQPRHAPPPGLAEQLVVGHEEYRRVTYRDLPFRRAFAEVFRQRSLLFLGAGIKETYLQELFGEVIEIFGQSSRPHYAIMPQGEVDPDFMLARFQIRVVEFPKGAYEQLPSWLDAFAGEVKARKLRPITWSWGGATGKGSLHTRPSLEIVRDILPWKRDGNACLAVSAGGRRKTYAFSDGIKRVIESWTGAPLSRPTMQGKFVGEFMGKHVFAVRTRRRVGSANLMAVYDASLELFELASAKGHERIHMQLLATGGADEYGAPVGNATPFPARFSLIQTIRAWREWRKRSGDSKSALRLYVASESVTMEIAAGRLDPLELLSCDDVRFSTEITRDDGRIERRLFERQTESTTLHDVVEALDLSPEHWTVEVSPSTFVKNGSGLLIPLPLSAWGIVPLEAVGVVPGSTLHFRRIDPAAKRRIERARK